LSTTAPSLGGVTIADPSVSASVSITPRSLPSTVPSIGLATSATPATGIAPSVTNVAVPFGWVLAENKSKERTRLSELERGQATEEQAVQETFDRSIIASLMDG
jgi:hypothetical protein